jgi:hypothetical protein
MQRIYQGGETEDRRQCCRMSDAGCPMPDDRCRMPDARSRRQSTVDCGRLRAKP